MKRSEERVEEKGKLIGSRGLKKLFVWPGEGRGVGKGGKRTFKVTNLQYYTHKLEDETGPQISQKIQPGERPVTETPNAPERGDRKGRSVNQSKKTGKKEVTLRGNTSIPRRT